MPKPKSSRKQTRFSPKTKHVLAPPPGRLGQPGVDVSDPQFGETKYTPDPTQFLHAVTDKQYYKVVDKETVNQLIQSIPPPRDPKNLLLSLADVYGSKGSVKVAAIINAKQIVFHSVGDTGPTSGPKTVQEVADKMCGDMQEASAADIPSFFFSPRRRGL